MLLNLVNVGGYFDVVIVMLLLFIKGYLCISRSRSNIQLYAKKLVSSFNSNGRSDLDETYVYD